MSSTNQADYEELLAYYSHAKAVVGLLKQYRPYLEMLPSMRRSESSVITIPLPIVQLKEGVSYTSKGSPPITPGQSVCLPCDLGVLMCDPEWQVKTGVEIFVFIQRPQEDLSDLLMRWRQTQVWLNKDYEWVMPYHYQHIYPQPPEGIFPLFVLFPNSPERIKKGLMGARLPYVVASDVLDIDLLNDHEIASLTDNFPFPETAEAEELSDSFIIDSNLLGETAYGVASDNNDDEDYQNI